MAKVVAFAALTIKRSDPDALDSCIVDNIDRKADAAAPTATSTATSTTTTAAGAIIVAQYEVVEIRPFNPETKIAEGIVQLKGTAPAVAGKGRGSGKASKGKGKGEGKNKGKGKGRGEEGADEGDEAEVEAEAELEGKGKGKGKEEEENEEGPGTRGVGGADGRLHVCKGSVTQVLEKCGEAAGIARDSWSPARVRIEQQVSELAGRGMRALGVAWRDTTVVGAPGSEASKEGHEEGWVFAGLLSFFDPPRPDSAATIAAIKGAGVDVKMITGDHLLIAIETASRLGMGTPTELFIYGPEFFRAVDAGALTFEGVDVRDIVHSADGFAGVTPKHKYFIVDQLQKFNGARHLVGMAGDGVNDAPALFKADVGIAVHGATDAAKAAADLVLLAPGISVIGGAVDMARCVFESGCSRT